MVWQNIYATTETDIDKLEATYLDKSQAFLERPRLIEHKSDDDYQAMLADLGVTEILVREQSENESDQISFPQGSYKVKIGPSGIEGRGLIATSDIDANEIICPARIGGLRTPAGRYTNHAKTPNAMALPIGEDIYLVALRPISGCRGGEDGEEITVNYRESVAVTLRIGQ
jgi:hypothetical protein